jgi:hypothetical protein
MFNSRFNFIINANNSNLEEMIKFIKKDFYFVIKKKTKYMDGVIHKLTSCEKILIFQYFPDFEKYGIDINILSSKDNFIDLIIPFIFLIPYQLFCYLLSFSLLLFYPLLFSINFIIYIYHKAFDLNYEHKFHDFLQIYWGHIKAIYNMPYNRQTIYYIM